MPDDRMREIADKVEIQEVLARHALAVDAGALGRPRHVFADGAVVDFSNNGGACDTFPAIKGYLEQSLSIFAAIQHYMMNFVIDVHGDTATARHYTLAQMVSIVDGADQLLADGGFYDSTFVRTPDGWRIQEFVASLVWLDGEWPEGVPRPGWWGVSSDRFGSSTRPSASA